MLWNVGEEWQGTREAELSPAAVDAFVASMPPGYRVLFDPRTVRRHAGIADRRGERLAHVELWNVGQAPAALCVVAEDRPGLLSSIAAALVFHHLDVVTALVFSRALPEGGREAVDLFWVRRADAADGEAIDAAEAASIGEIVSALLSGTLSIEETSERPSEPPAAGAPRVLVRFEGEEHGVTILHVEAPDRPGILFAIARVLFTQGTQIIRSLVRTADGRVYNRFELTELSGAPLVAERQGQIASAVLSALAWDADPAVGTARVTAAT